LNRRSPEIRNATLCAGTESFPDFRISAIPLDVPLPAQDSRFVRAVSDGVVKGQKSRPREDLQARVRNPR
jgi:hypothetical protein